MPLKARPPKSLPFELVRQQLTAIRVPILDAYRHQRFNVQPQSACILDIRGTPLRFSWLEERVYNNISQSSTESYV